MRIVFMGTPDFSVSALDTLHQAGHDIVAVYSQPPRRAGRGKKERPSPVHSRAEQLSLEVRHPVNFKDPNDVAEFKDLNADVAVVVAYGLLLPQNILDAPKRGCLNIHASLLPRWRGAAPIHRAIMSGDQKTGVCIMQMEIGLDTGPVLMRDETSISIEDTTLSLHDRLAKIGADLIAKTLDGLDNLKAIPQPEEGVTYAKKIDKTEAKINWDDTAQNVDRKIRGLSPFPGAWFDFGQDRIKVLMSRIAEGEGTAGQVLDNEITVSCGSGAIKLITLQRAGKGPMETQDFLRGFAINKGDTL